MAYLELKKINYKYPTSEGWILEDINLEINKGEFWAVVGKNGSGKTTLCNIIRGFAQSFYRGEITGELIIDGKNIENYSEGELATKIGFVFQNPFIQISGVKETVYDEIAFGLENLGLEIDYIKNKVEEILELLQIGALRDKNPFELSGGQRQRIALASIIAMEPDILVIDEPTSQLDPEGTEDIFKIIEIMKKKGKTIILVEHKIELVAEYAEHIAVLDEGKIILKGKSEQILNNRLLLDKEIGMPKYSVLGYELEKNGIKLPYIPTTRKEAEEMLKVLIEKRGRKMSFVEVKDVVFQYPDGTVAIDGINFSVEKGERVAIVGQNGAGKTTAVKLLNGLLKPTKGDVIIDSWNTKDYTTAKMSRKVGYVFQNPDDQIFHNSVEDEIFFGPKKIGYSSDETERLVNKAVELTELGAELKENPYNLPYSIRKFVTIAAVISMGTDVIILDEPTAGQDLKGMKILNNLIKKLNEEGKTIITITHDMEFVVNNFERIIVMAHRNIIDDGNKKEIFWKEDILKESKLKQPYISNLANRLNLGNKVLTIEEFIEAVKE